MEMNNGRINMKHRHIRFVDGEPSPEWTVIHCKTHIISDKVIDEIAKNTTGYFTVQHEYTAFEKSIDATAFNLMRLKGA